MSLQKYTPQQVFSNGSITKRFEKVLGDSAKGFVASVLQIINSNDMLSDCDPDSLYSASMTAAALDLPINPNLGFAYIIPYRKGKGRNSRVIAQFQMGYKGYIQLAQRSAQYKTISAAPIYDGQLINEDPLRGFEFDFTNKQSDTVIGYASYFKLLNGFEKIFYMTADQVEKHAKTYSQSYKSGYGVWNDDFEAMAVKTVLKLLISKYGPMSVDLEKAIEADQGEIKDPQGIEIVYPDNEQGEPKPPANREIDTGGNGAEVEGENKDQRQALYSSVTKTAKDVFGDDWYNGIKKNVIAIDKNSENMMDLSTPDLKTLEANIEKEASGE